MRSRTPYHHKKFSTNFIFTLILFGCSQHQPEKNQSTQPQDIKYIENYSTRIDATDEMNGVTIYDEDHEIFHTRALINSKNVGYSHSGNGSNIPKSLRAIWRTGEVRSQEKYGDFSGKISADYTIPVESRIPKYVVENINQEGGSFRLKIRLHPQGILMGWDVERRPGYKPDTGLYYPPYFDMAGGDFREANILYYEKIGPGIYNALPTPIHKKGWYIHPITHEKIETDF